jgi:hypothetical protein
MSVLTYPDGMRHIPLSRFQLSDPVDPHRLPRYDRPMPTPASAAAVLAVMRVLEPSSPYAGTFESTADSIAARATAEPLFQGEDGPSRTAALLVSLGWFESRFQPDARGDCDHAHTTRQGTCASGGRASSFCLFQLNASNLTMLGTTEEQLTSDVDACVASAIRMLRSSLSVCARLPLEERLAWYAGGGATCMAPSEDARRKSRHRWAKAMWVRERMRTVVTSS